MTKATRIQDCITHHHDYVQVLATLPDSRLREKLDTIHLQLAIAEQQRDTPSIELLELWRAQTIEARTYKAENKIPDAVNEIQEAIADIESYIAPPPVTPQQEPTLTYRPRPKTSAIENSQEQLSIF